MPRSPDILPTDRETAARARVSAPPLGDVGRREEPPRYESGFRAHASNQRFHRLQRHAVARALTTAPSLAGVSPAAGKILTPQGWRRRRRPGRCRTKNRRCEPVTNRRRAGLAPADEPRSRLEEASYSFAFSSRPFLSRPLLVELRPPLVSSPQQCTVRPRFMRQVSLRTKEDCRPSAPTEASGHQSGSGRGRSLPGRIAVARLGLRA